jgi:hypothetical protein
MNKKDTPKKFDGIDYVKSIPDSQYIYLVDGSVARLLKPTIKNDKKYFNLRIKGEIGQYSVDEIEKLAK